MAKLTIYLDKRTGKEEHPLKIRIQHNDKSAYVNLDLWLRPENWDGVNVSGTDNDADNNEYIKGRMIIAESVCLKLKLSGKINGMTATELKRVIENNGETEEEKKGTPFMEYFIECAEKKRKESTTSSYMQALKNLQLYDPLLSERVFEDIDYRYIQSFDRWMESRGIRQNSRNVYFRNIRSVINDAIDEELTTTYPFRKFKLKKVATRKRSLSVEELRILRDHPCEEWQEKYRDIFMLMFYLCGINGADLLPAKKRQVRNGRLEYERAKTYKQYSIKIEPEAQAIIDKYKGNKILLQFCEGDKDYKYFLQRMSRELKLIGPYKREGKGGKKVYEPLFPDLSQYWCRHTWATIAAELDIPKETIAAALGHDMGNTTTAIYINFNQKKVDEANRMVIDFVNGNPQ